MNLDLLKTATTWFVESRCPDFKEEMDSIIFLIEQQKDLCERQRKIIALSVFSYSMYEGPQCFHSVKNLVIDIGVYKELEYYANDWVNYATTRKLQQLKDLLN